MTIGPQGGRCPRRPHRRLTDLSEKDVRDSIEAVTALADGLDDGFAAKYSGTSRRRGAVAG